QPPTTIVSRESRAGPARLSRATGRACACAVQPARVASTACPDGATTLSGGGAAGAGMRVRSSGSIRDRVHRVGSRRPRRTRPNVLIRTGGEKRFSEPFGCEGGKTFRPWGGANEGAPLTHRGPRPNGTRTVRPP